eukprot:gene11890-5556_t
MILLALMQFVAVLFVTIGFGTIGTEAGGRLFAGAERLLSATAVLVAVKALYDVFLVVWDVR